MLHPAHSIGHGAALLGGGVGFLRLAHQGGDLFHLRLAELDGRLLLAAVSVADEHRVARWLAGFELLIMIGGRSFTLESAARSAQQRDQKDRDYADTHYFAHVTPQTNWSISSAGAV